MDDREKMVARMKLCDILMDELPQKHPWEGEVSKLVDRLIANGVTVQQHGRWERRKTGNMISVSDTVCAPEYKEFCTVCNLPNKHYKPPYCPHCGAKMDLPEPPKGE